MRYTVLSIALICGALAIHGADIWTYTDCVEYARNHNISLQKTRLSEQTADYNLEEAEAQWQPTLDFATTHGFANYPWSKGNKNTYNSSYGLNAGWTVWNGGTRENNIKRSKIQQEISRLNTGDARRSLETDLLQVYINILYAREAIGIYQEAVRLSKAQADRAKALWEAGRASKVDYAQLRSQEEQDNYALVNAQATYDSRRMEMKRLLELGVNIEIELEDVEWTAEQVLAELPPLEESFNMAVATDLTIQSLGLSKESAAIDVELAKASGRPSISLNAGIGSGYSAPGFSFGPALKSNLNESVGLTLSVPILNNKRSSMATARAKVDQITADLDIEQRRTDLAQAVENWFIDTHSAQSRYIAAEEQLKSATLTNELTNEQFSLGLVNPIELMTAHNNLIEAQHTLLQAKYMAMLGHKMIEYYRTASVTLN